MDSGAMPSAIGQNCNLTMESLSPVETGISKQSDDDSSVFICTECGDGFNQYSKLLTHMVSHGPLDLFPLDGSSNGFEVAREYVLHENGTLTIVNGFEQSQFIPAKPKSPGFPPLQPPPHIKSPTVIPSLPSGSSHHKDILRLKLLEAQLNVDKSSQGHYRCEICSRSFNSQLSLHRHQQYRNTERGYKCTLCCKIFEGREELKIHLQDHALERFYCCRHCGKRFLKVDALNSHEKGCHQSVKVKPLGLSENNMERRVEKTYPCKKCRLHFFWLSDFQTHSLYQCKGKEPGSDIEEKSRKEKGTLNYKHHSNGISIDLKNPNNGKNGNATDTDVNTENSIRPYRCGFCGDRFQKLAALKEHHLTHQTQEEIDLLNQESKRTLKRTRMGTRRGRRRRRGNLNGKLHPCKLCHRVFHHSSSLSRHMRYHKGTMHTCVFCGRHFPQRCDVRRHVAMYHKAELEKKPGLKHMALHTTPQRGSALNSFKERKYKKSLDCEKKEPDREEQKGRQRGKPSSKTRQNYKCQECGKKFGLLCVYQRHLRYHNKEPTESHKCPHCPAQFRKLSTLEHHLENHKSTSTREADVKGQTSSIIGTNQVPDLEKITAEDIEDEDHGTTAEVLYECTECTETFSCLDSFLKHQISHGSESCG